jgi:mRNA interferase MazF
LEKLVVGSVVVTSFPYSDLRAHKNRPALVLGFSDFNDVVLCQITSVEDGELKKVKLTKESFKRGGLPSDSYIRPDKIFTTDLSLISKNIGLINSDSLVEVKEILKDFFKL